jgi:hypothetical protein
MTERQTVATTCTTCEALREVVSDLVSNNGRYIVLCDDGSLLATDDLMDGDNVIIDRGEDW